MSDASIQGYVLAAAETPLQLFNLIALLQTPGFVEGGTDIVLVVFDQFKAEQKLKESLRNCRLFSSVHFVDYYYSQSRSIAFQVSLERCLLNKRHEEKVQGHLSGIPRKPYSFLLAGCATAYAMDLKQEFVWGGSTIFYEEGEGSYLGNFVKSAATFDREILKKSKTFSRRIITDSLYIFSRGRLCFDALELRLYRPDLVSADIYQSHLAILPISQVSRATTGVLTDIFDEPSDCSSLGWVVLGAPDASLKKTESNRLRKAAALIASFHSSVQIRNHPRGSSYLAGLSDSTKACSGHYMWEVLCLFGLVGNHTVLFGNGSTAQTNPKRMFGLEPTLVFLHRLLDEGINKSYAERSYRSSLAIYDDKSKIYCPNSIDDLGRILEKLAKNE